MDNQIKESKYSYHPVYLDDAQKTLGAIFDVIYHETNYDIDEFMQIFIDSGVALCFGCGDAREHGRSSVELIREALSNTNSVPIERRTYIIHNSTAAYWAGWILAFYQWYTNQTFEEIYQYLKPSDIIGMYILHEASEMRFVREIDKRREYYFQKLIEEA